MKPETTKKWLRHQIKYWWAYGLAGAVIMVVFLWLYGAVFTPNKVLTIAGIGFLNGGVLLRFIAKYNLSQMERTEKNNNINE